MGMKWLLQEHYFQLKIFFVKVGVNPCKYKGIYAQVSFYSVLHTHKNKAQAEMYTQDSVVCTTYWAFLLL